jgi:hypothetical protein
LKHLDEVRVRTGGRELAVVAYPGTETGDVDSGNVVHRDDRMR